MGTGQKATGDPIKLGGIATNVPGIDFTWITGMTKAYFDCVNDNGGINGRPIEYIAEDEQIDPQQIAGARHEARRAGRGARPRRQHEHHRLQRQQGLLRRQQGFYPIIAGVDQACFTSPNFSAVNMGPYYSSLGGAQAALRAGAKGKIVIVSPNQPGFDLINSGVVDFAKQQRHEGHQPHRGRADRRPGRPRPEARAGRPVTAAASCSTSPARRSCRCCRPSSSRA